MTVKSSISLTDAQHDFARRMVDAGRYSSLSAVIQQGLDLLQRKTEEDEADLVALRLLLERRRAGPFISMDEMDARVERMIAEKRRAHGLDE